MDEIEVIIEPTETSEVTLTEETTVLVKEYKAGKNIKIDDYTIDCTYEYTLPSNVVKDGSYVHTDNNYTTEEKQKLASLENADLSDYYTKAEADKAAKILEAEATKEALIAEAQGTADAINLIVNAKADSAYITLQGFEALKKLADGQATKIIIPSDIQNITGLLASVQETLNVPSPEVKATKSKKD